MSKYLWILLIVPILVTNKTIKVGVTTSDNPNNPDKPGSNSVYMISVPMTIGHKIGIDYVNKNIFPLTIDGEIYDKMELVHMDDEYDTEVAINIYRNWIDNNLVDLYLSPYSTIADPPGAPQEDTVTYYTESNEIIMLSAVSPFDTFSAYPRQWSFTIETLMSYYMAGTILPLRIGGAKTAAFLSSSSTMKALCSDKVEQFLLDAGIEVIYKEDFNDAGTLRTESMYTYDPEILEGLRTVAQNTINSGADIWYICSANPKISLYLRDYLYNSSYTPKSMVTVCGDEWTTLEEGDKLKSFMLCVTPERSDTIIVDKRFGTLDEFKKLYSNYGNITTYNSYSYNAALSIAIYAELLELSGTKDQHVLRDFLRRYNTMTYKGKVYWDAFHDQQNSGFVVQANISNNMNTIYPYEASIAEHVYPEPQWNERIYDKNRYKTAEIVLGIFACIGIILNLLWIIYLVIFRNKKTIIAASPLFMVLCIIGSTISYLYVFFAYPRISNYIASCHLSYWSLALGFGLTYTPLIAKTWRIDRLFDSSTFDIIVIRNSQVFLVVLALMTPIIIMMCVITGLTPSSVYTNIVDINKPYYNYYTCDASNGSSITGWVLIAYCILLFIIGAILAIKVRRIEFRVYDESKIIGISMYNTGLFSILMLIIMNVDVSYITKYVVMSVFIIVANLITINVLMGHKLYYINDPDSTKSDSTNNSGNNNHNMGSIRSRNGTQST